MALSRDRLGNDPATGLAGMAPSPHFLAQNFLGPELVDRLLRYCADNEAGFVPTSVGDGASSKLDYQLRRSLTLAKTDDFTHELRQIFQSRLAALSPTLMAALRLSPFVPAKHEMELTAHNDGAFFGRHIDTFTGGADVPAQRMVTAVYYFFARPRRFSGGALRLYPLLDASDNAQFVDIEPVNDGLVCFPSFAPHAVQPIACPSGRFIDSRFAINNWICRAAPPAAGST